METHFTGQTVEKERAATGGELLTGIFVQHHTAIHSVLRSVSEEVGEQETVRT